MRNLPDNCPPIDARAFVGKIYRFARVLTPAEFETHFIRFPGRDWKDKVCEAHGLSVCVTLGEARLLQRLVPGMLKKQITVAELNGAAGEVAQTGLNPQHHTWWPADQFDVVEAFELVEVA